MTEENKTEESTALELITNLGTQLGESVDNEVKQLPKWKVDALMKFKDEHLGNLKQQLSILRRTKRDEFVKMYAEEMTKIKSELELEYTNLTDEKDNLIIEIKKELSQKYFELIKKSPFNKLSNEINQNPNFNLDSYDESEIMEIVEGKITKSEDLLNFGITGLSFRIDKDFSSLTEVPKLFFELEYGQSFTNVKNQIITMEKEYKKALLFNNLVIAFNLYKEMEKADKLLDNVSKFETPKIEINFNKYMDSVEFEKLEKEVEMLKKYEFVEQHQ